MKRLPYTNLKQLLLIKPCRDIPSLPRPRGEPAVLRTSDSPVALPPRESTECPGTNALTIRRASFYKCERAVSYVENIKTKEPVSGNAETGSFTMCVYFSF